MAIDLPDVVQKWEADVQDYLDGMAEVIGAAKDAAEANLEAAAAVKTLQVVIDDLHGKTIDLGIDSQGAAAANDVAAALGKIAAVAPAAAAGLRDASEASAGLGGAEAVLGHELPDISADLMMQTASLRVMAESMQAVQRDVADASADLMAQTAILRDLRDAWLQNAAAAAISGAAGAGAGTRMAAGASQASRAWALNIGWLRLSATALHWIVAGTAEFLAVAIPGTVAFAAGLAVAMQGAQMAQIHMTALYDTLEAVGPAFGKTVGSILGMKSSLQQAQDAANPGIYEILGSAVNDAKARFQDFAAEGLLVVHMWDEFSARVTVDMQGAFGAQLHSLLAGGVSDLQQFGQVLGNLGHAILNLASDMPGLAQALLIILDGFTRLLDIISEVPAPIITVAMAFEEFYRWGGLVLTMLVRLTGQMGAMDALGATNFITRFGVALITLLSLGANALIWAGQMIGRLAGVSGAFGTLGTAVANAGARLFTFASSLTPLSAAGIAAVVAGMGVLAVVLDKVRNNSEQLIDTTNKLAAQAPDAAAAMQYLALGAAKAAVALQQQEGVLQSYPGSLQATGEATGWFVSQLQHLNGPLGGVAQGIVNVTANSNVFTRAIGQAVTQLDPVAGLLHLFGGGAAAAASQVDQLRAAETQWAQQGAQMVTNAQTLAGVFRTSLPAAMELADEAGVNLNQTWAKGSMAMKIAEQQVRNLITGLGAMGAPAGVIGTDMDALAISAGLATTKVQQVTQALDAMFSLVSGGIGTFSQLIQSVNDMAHASSASKVSLAGAFGSLDTGASNAKYSLQGLGTSAMQSLQQVTAALGNANSEADFFQTALAAGAISAGGFTSAIKDIVGIMVPFAHGNAAVAASLSLIAQRGGAQANMSLRQLAQWAGIRGPAAMRALESAVGSTSTRLANLSGVAQHLGTVMQSQMTAAFSAAVLKSLNYNTAMQNLAATLAKYPAASSQVHAAIAKVNAIQNEAATITRKFGQATASSATQTHHLAAAASSSAGNLNALQTATAQVAEALDKHQISAKLAAISTYDLQDKVSGLSGAEQGSSGTRDTVNQQLQKQQVQSQQTATAVFTLQQRMSSMSGEALTAAGKMITLATEIGRAGAQASTASGQVFALASAISNLQSKTITITTNMVTSAAHRAAGGPVAPGLPYVVGEAGRELFVPSSPGYILPNPETRQFLSGGSASGGGGGISGGTQVIHLEATIDNHLNVDGQEMWRGQQRKTMQYNVRNAGGQPTGRVVPGRG